VGAFPNEDSAGCMSKAEMMTKVAVVTGTRAEYGTLKPLLDEIKASEGCELKLVVTGMHLLQKYGSTINDIKEDGFKIDAEIRMYEESESDDTYFGKALARGTDGFTNVLLQMNPHILVVLGDRLEPLAATLAAATLRIPIAHIHSGDKTDSGHIDESIRHSITRFAHIHFAPTDGCADRLIKMGEEPWRIRKVGALNLDAIVNQQPIPKEELSAKLGLNPRDPIIVCIFHSIHLEKETAGWQMREILEALKELKVQTVTIYPNNDAGSEDIITEIEKQGGSSFIKIFPTLSHTEYISLLKHAAVLIGNSSSGIIEAPSLKLPVVNIGSRNVGREHAENVIFVDTVKNEILKAIETALRDEKFRQKVRQCENPWGDGKATEKIVRVLSGIEIDTKLMQKKITY
jgi:GDP/UDP-N,N'-diacetylbacillosamine 2-epimerase (hydrolysing)